MNSFINLCIQTSSARLTIGWIFERMSDLDTGNTSKRYDVSKLYRKIRVSIPDLREKMRQKFKRGAHAKSIRQKFDQFNRYKLYQIIRKCTTHLLIDIDRMVIWMGHISVVWYQNIAKSKFMIGNLWHYEVCLMVLTF